MIKYLRDNNLDFYDILESSLAEHNNKYANSDLNKDYYVHVKDGSKVVASCHAQLYWNWVFIESIVFNQDIELDVILKTLYSETRQCSSGVHIETCNEMIKESLLTRNYNSICEMHDKPCGITTSILVNHVLEERIVSDYYEVSVEEVPNMEYQEFVLKSDSRIKITDIDESSYNKIAYMVYDDETWIGGVYGYIISDYLHVNLLWLQESYRGKGIAKELMRLLHEGAYEIGCRNSFVETCTFHNREFYENLGYKLKCSLANMPVGYTDYILTKTLI